MTNSNKNTLGKSEKVFFSNSDKAKETLNWLKKEEQKLKNEEKRQDINMRKVYADHIFTLVSLYMFAVFFILILNGSPSSFHLSDTVLVTLLGTTTANVIGVLIVVAKYLFPNKK